MGNCGEDQAANRLVYNLCCWAFVDEYYWNVVIDSTIFCAFNSRPFPLDNHGLCPEFYISAFRNTFPAVVKNKTCNQPLDERDLKQLPNHTIRMGYFQSAEDAKSLNGVNLYAVTTRDAPYNR